MQLLEEYLDSILEQVHPLTPIELPIEEALDHVLACDLEARVAVPPFSNSGMDGFAIYLDEDYEGSPETLRPETIRITFLSLGVPGES